MGEALRGERLVALRELQGLSQDQLATSLGVSAAFLSQVSSGKKVFSEALAQSAAARYQVPRSFFTVAPHPADAGVATFLKTSKARVRDEKRVVRHFVEASRLFRETSAASGYHAAALPDPDDYGRDPERLAAAVRKMDGLDSSEPVKNMTRLCERLGIGVIHDLDPEASETSQHKALSMPTGATDRPLIALSCRIDPAEKRLAIAHELGHLISDRDLTQSLRLRRDPREKAADRFARALLVPEEFARARISPSLTLHGFLRVKADVGVGVRPLVQRAADLGIIDPDRARSLYIQWSSSQWKDNEPVDVADERPLLLDQALQQIHGRSAAARASHMLGVPSALISRWAPAASRSEDAEIYDLSVRRRSPR